MMNWYHYSRGGHTHVSVFINGGLCGHLTLENKEFDDLVKRKPRCITFISRAAEAKLNERKN